MRFVVNAFSGTSEIMVLGGFGYVTGPRVRWLMPCWLPSARRRHSHDRRCQAAIFPFNAHNLQSTRHVRCSRCSVVDLLSLLLFSATSRAACVAVLSRLAVLLRAISKVVCAARPRSRPKFSALSCPFYVRFARATQALSKYGRDLTQAAKDGKLDPVIGRDDEIRRTVQILSRRTKNNPILLGEPGTTAL